MDSEPRRPEGVRTLSVRTAVRISIAESDEDAYDAPRDTPTPTQGRRSAASGYLGVPSIANTPEPSDGRASASSSRASLPSQVSSNPWRSSIAKPPRGSLTLSQEGSIGTFGRAGAHSSASSIDSHFSRSNASFHEASSGPSHPYQMYPQTVMRASQTSSALGTRLSHPPSERRYSGPLGPSPSHPYGLYHQRTESATGVPRRPPVAVRIPVGFPGASDTYRRRFGSDGEMSGDFVGPDGHTEELPPYSRYPVEVIGAKLQRANSQATHSSATTSSLSASPIEAIPGAGGLGMATRNPAFDYDAPSSMSQQSSRSSMSDSSTHEINLAAAKELAMSRAFAEPRWKQVSKRRVWGVVPCWAISLAVTAVVILAIIVGAVVGVMFSKTKKSDEPSSASDFGGYSDAVPLDRIPPGLPNLPLGTFFMPMIPSAVTSSCLSTSAQSKAWSCIMTPALPMHAVIARSREESEMQPYEATLQCNASARTYAYYDQPPCFAADRTRLTLVTDVSEPSKGPAWWFGSKFDKVVILPESAFVSVPTATAVITTSQPAPTSPAARQRRGTSADTPYSRGDPPRIGGMSNAAVVGDKPWICTWNRTMVEMFVYPQQNSTSMRYSSLSARAADSFGLGAATSQIQGSGSSTIVTGTSSSTGGEASFVWPPNIPGGKGGTSGGTGGSSGSGSSGGTSSSSGGGGSGAPSFPPPSSGSGSGSGSSGSGSASGGVSSGGGGSGGGGSSAGSGGGSGGGGGNQGATHAASTGTPSGGASGQVASQQQQSPVSGSAQAVYSEPAGSGQGGGTNTQGGAAAAPSSSSVPNTSGDSTTPAGATTSGTSNDGTRGWDPSMKVYPYPRVFKIEERRLPNSPPASCQQVEIIEGGNTRPVLDASGKPIVIAIPEIVDGPSRPASKRAIKTNPHGPRTFSAKDELEAAGFDVSMMADLDKRGTGDSGKKCECVWFNT